MPATGSAPATLETTTARLRGLAHTLVINGVAEEDLMDLIQASRDHYAQYFLDVAIRSDLPTAHEAVHRGVRLAAEMAHLVPFTINVPPADGADEYRYCGATIDRPDGSVFTCARRVAHRGTPCSPDRDED